MMMLVRFDLEIAFSLAVDHFSRGRPAHTGLSSPGSRRHAVIHDVTLKNLKRNSDSYFSIKLHFCDHFASFTRPLAWPGSFVWCQFSPCGGPVTRQPCGQSSSRAIDRDNSGGGPTSPAGNQGFSAHTRAVTASAESDAHSEAACKQQHQQ